MKTHRNLVVSTVAVAIMSLLATQALGQYATPLRYDLRYSTPSYIPSGALRFNPVNPQDPYAFGSAQYGNLSLTGNLRLGRSFRGNTPYRSTGTQLSRDLPSLRLSDFRRDSVGIEDLGTGVERGLPAPYFPGSGSVTTPYTADNRFRTPLPGARAPYAPRNLNAPQVASGAGTVDPDDVALSPSSAARVLGPQDGVPATGIGLTLPRSALDFVDNLIEGGRGAALTGKGDERLTSPYDAVEAQFAPKPGNIYDPDAKPGAESAADAPGRPEMLWPAPGDKGDTGASWLSGQGEAPSLTLNPRVPAATAPEDSWPEDLPEEEAPIPVPPDKYQPVSTYAAYVQRAHAAMQQSAYDKAEALYSAAAALEPDRPAAFFGRIHAMLGRRMYLQAIVVLDRELMRSPDRAKAAPDLKSVYPEGDVYLRILRNLRRELDAKPLHTGYNFLMGYAYFTVGEKPMARQYLEQAAKSRGKPGPELTFLKLMDDGGP